MSEWVEFKEWNAKGVVQATLRVHHAHIEKLARRLATEIKLSIADPFPPASRPGEPPHWRTGRLQRSVDYKMGGPGEADVHITAPYALYLEFGTHKMAARPHILPALLRMRKFFTKIEVHR